MTNWHPLLTRAVCAWAGVPLAESEVGRRTREIAALFNYAGSVGPKHWWSRLARRRANRWIEDIVDRIRAGQLHPPEGTTAHVIAWHRDLNGELLRPRVAAVEVLNVLRPTVAVAVYITFIAHALHQHLECRRKIEAGTDGYADGFVQEVRRFYPFFPSVGARVRHDFEWRGYKFPLHIGKSSPSPAKQRGPAGDERQCRRLSQTRAAGRSTDGG